MYYLSLNIWWIGELVLKKKVLSEMILLSNKWDHDQGPGDFNNEMND